MIGQSLTQSIHANKVAIDYQQRLVHAGLLLELQALESQCQRQIEAIGKLNEAIKTEEWQSKKLDNST